MKKWVIVLIHCVCWAAILLNALYNTYSSPSEFLKTSVASSGLPAALFYFIMHFCYLCVSLTAFYGFYFFVGPLLLAKKKYVAAFIAVAGVFCAMVVVRYVAEFYILVPHLKFHNYFWKTPETWYYIKNCILYTLNYCLFGFVAYVIVLQTYAEKEKRELEKEKISAELSFLKSQVNPHFLFNTINDVYALTYQKSDDAPEALLKLSGMLRYMIYDSSIEHTPLEKEINYLADYIALQNIGAKKILPVTLTAEGDIPGVTIAPMLLIPFVENIYKHGVIDDNTRPAVVHIRVDDNNFLLTAANYIKQQNKDETGGIGLKNIRRRLQLQYPGNHNFEVKENGETFSCLLQIKL